MTDTLGAPAGWPSATVPDFDDAELLGALEAVPLERLDDLGFGLIAMDRTGDVIWYNAFEARRAGLRVDQALGRNFFSAVGPCTENYLVAERYRQEPDLDDQLDYVFTLRMKPTPVRLRLLARRGSARQYLAVRSR